MRELIGRDHQLLHLYNSIQKDVYDRKGKLSLGSSSTDENHDDLQSFWNCCRQRKRKFNSCSEDPAVISELRMGRDWLEKPSKYNKFKAMCLLSFCCCFFRRRNGNKKEEKRISGKWVGHFVYTWMMAVSIVIVPDILTHYLIL